jgi:hypothetical protein
VDHTVATLPGLLRSALVRSGAALPSSVSSALRSGIAAFDDSIAHGVTALFPDGGAEGLVRLADADIRRVINDGGQNAAGVLRAMRGTTALVALVDPERRNLWVASLGDCQAGAPLLKWLSLSFSPSLRIAFQLLTFRYPPPRGGPSSREEERRGDVDRVRAERVPQRQ